MPLDTTALEDGLSALFTSPPITAEACAAAWAAGVRDYAAGVVPPSTTVAAAATVLEADLASAFTMPSGVAAFDAAFTSFAVTVGLGMAPAYTAAPPPAPLGVAALLATSQPTHEAAVAGFLALIDAWFRTGLATLVAPPNTIIPWS
jgi:hypothetical protein